MTYQDHPFFRFEQFNHWTSYFILYLYVPLPKSWIHHYLFGGGWGLHVCFSKQQIPLPTFATSYQFSFPKSFCGASIDTLHQSELWCPQLVLNEYCMRPVPLKVCLKTRNAFGSEAYHPLTTFEEPWCYGWNHFESLKSLLPIVCVMLDRCWPTGI